MSAIVVYDSDPRFGEVLKAALTSLGYEAWLATDAYAVVPFAEQHRPRLFIIDYKLPEVDGLEILKRIRSSPSFALTPVIFASATPKFEIEMTVLDTPAVGYIDKPLDAQQLKEAIEALIGPLVKAAPAPVAAPAPAPQPPPMYIPPPGAPLAPPAPLFTGEPDLDGQRDDVIDLD
jgi:DNA-binding response OmpR family regulator